MPENTAECAKLCLRLLGRSAFECAILCQVHGSRGAKGGNASVKSRRTTSDRTV